MVRSLHCVNMESVTDVSEAHVASVFSFNTSRMGECSCIYRILVQDGHESRAGASAPYRANRGSGRGTNLTFPCPPSARTGHQTVLSPPPNSINTRTIITFLHDDRDSICPRNVGNTVHIHTGQKTQEQNKKQRTNAKD
jgi:hypothetical protein